MWEVGFWLHWQLWGTRRLSGQEMTWPSLWEASPAWHQPPLLGASRVTLSTHKGQRSDSSPAGGRENKNMLCCFPFDRIKRKGDFIFSLHMQMYKKIKITVLKYVYMLIIYRLWGASRLQFSFNKVRKKIEHVLFYFVWKHETIVGTGSWWRTFVAECPFEQKEITLVKAKTPVCNHVLVGVI